MVELDLDAVLVAGRTRSPRDVPAIPRLYPLLGVVEGVRPRAHDAGTGDTQTAVPRLLPVSVQNARATPGDAHPVAERVRRLPAVHDLEAASQLHLLDPVRTGHERFEMRRAGGRVLLAHPVAVGPQARDDAGAGRGRGSPGP